MTQELIQHNRAPLGHIHRVTNWRFDTTADRMDLDNHFTAKDIDKICYDAEADTYFILKSLDIGTGAPIWYPIPNTFQNIGESNTAASVGSGASIVAGKVGAVLQFKSLIAGTNVTLDLDGTSVTINVADTAGLYAPIAHVGSTGTSHGAATTSVAGFMSAADKLKLDGVISNVTHTGDVTGSGLLTIANDAVTFAKMQNSAVESVLVGRGQGAGAGNFQEILLGYGLSMTGNSLSVDAVLTNYDEIEASEDLLAGDLVNIYDDAGEFKVRKACADDEDTFCNGYVLINVGSGDIAQVYSDGANTAVLGQVAGSVYLSLTPGLGIATPPSGAGNIVQLVGTAGSATKLNFDFQPAVLLA